MKWKTRKVKYIDLMPVDYNPRKLSDSQREDLEKSLKKFGVVEIPAMNLDMTLLAGHQRVEVALSIYGKDYEDDVRYPETELTEKEAKEYNIRSNKNTGSWDFSKLDLEFDKDLLMDWGFESFELIDNEFDIDDYLEDAVPEREKSLENKKITCPHCGGEI